MIPDKKNYSIQALRAIAAILVVVVHTITQFNSYNNLTSSLGVFLKNIETFGLVGVYVFFIISGYIMSMTTKNYRGGLGDAWVFLKKRIFRIFPTYWIWLTILVVMWILGFALRSHNYSIEKIFSSYTLLPYSENNSTAISPMLSQGWTLVYEMFYYYLFTFFIFLKLKNIKSIISIFISFFILFFLAKNQLLPNKSLDSLFSNGVMFFFPIGMLIFHFQQKIMAVFSSVLSKASILVALGGILLYISIRNTNEYDVESNVLCSMLIFMAFFVYNIKTRLLSIIGDASYSIYLSHTFIVMAYGIVSKSSRFSSNTLLIMSIFVFFGSIAFGIASYYLIENRINNITKRFTTREKLELS